ncbi:hypothetical protein EB75_21355 [Mycobacterium sp. ST-F2]|uniref:hypothetical protein n=1 Tax=Mycobacterium sp. ST-F2 TaxID=1490484 RepID=UPI00093D7870|nr:hypothetical protein [Mycobacterium sp. ST-F2]OKH80122.1 hypothetical protein EB75_21355 [Mycobacterium sp. ST-F2]
MLDRWQVLQCAPGTVAHPDQLAEKWPTAVVFDAPSTVATVSAENPDDFDWWCRSTLTLTERARVEFQGLSFPARIFRNGTPVADCPSMFLPTGIDCSAGEHEFVIHFGAMNHWLKARRPRGRWRSTLVGTPGLRWARTSLIGRAPVYGNLPAPVGIWRPITVVPARLHTEVVARVEDNSVTVSGRTGAGSIRVVLRDPTGGVVADDSTAPAADGRYRFAATIDEPLQWWPNGYGRQHLYQATVEADGVEVAVRQLGFRTVEVSTEGFRISVNGTPIFCRGATWSPPDPVRMYADATQIRDQARTLAAAGANMVRVVGGLAYEQDEFWQACAQEGLMVWQDAMLATFDPPAEQGELIARELATVLQRVSGNPALMVVSGGSETLQQPEMLGLSSHDSEMDVLETLLPEAVAEYSDAHYVRASPSPPPGSTDLAIRPDTGVAHWFGVGGYLRPISDVQRAGVRFAAECLAFANPPSSGYVDQHFGSAAVAGHHPEWKMGVPRDRGSSWDFEDIRDFYARAVFGEEPLLVRRVDPERYLQLGRLAIATAMRECFAFWRRADSNCGGALVLSGRDLAPGAGWGLLDSEGGTKPALEVLARTWAPVSVILADDGLAGVRIDIHNDTGVSLRGESTLLATNSSGVAVEAVRPVVVPSATSVTWADSDVSGHFRDLSHAFRFGTPTADAVHVEVTFDDGTTVRDVLVLNPRPNQPPSTVTAIVTKQTDDQWVLELTSSVALRYVEIDAPGWTMSDNYFHLAGKVLYAVTMVPNGDVDHPTGTVGSIDLTGRVPLGNRS